MDIFFKNDGSYSQSTVGIPVLVDYTPVGFVREVNADMVTCSLFDKFIGKEWLAQRLTTKEPDICSVYIDTKCLFRFLKVRLTTWMTRGLIKKKYENNFEYGVGLKKRSRLF